MTDIEHIAEHWINQIVSDYKGSDTRLKMACLRSEKVVGKYSLGATRTIAARTRRSSATVENWAHAARLYLDVRSNGNRPRARALWRSLPASHWWLAYDIQNAGYDALFYLTNAYANKFSGREMLQEFDRDRKAGYAPLIFKRACLSFYGLALELSKRQQELTQGQRDAVEAVRTEFEEDCGG